MSYTYSNSTLAFNRAQQRIPGGVNSPVRAFKSVGGTPIFMKAGKGTYLTDIDDQSYIDLINSWGPMILGHSHPQVVEAVRKQALQLFSSGTPSELESEMAEQIHAMVPTAELIRLVNSGTEACMSAIRLARGYTGRHKFIKFAGNYHGHADCFLVKAGSGLATFDIEKVPGVTPGVGQDTLIAQYNNLDQVKELVALHPDEIAAIILEPIAGNMGCIPPTSGFLEGLRSVCDEHGIVLIFDEVMTGFRVSAGGAQELYGVEADLCTYGKIIGGGMPIGAFAGKRKIMEHIAPLGSVYQAGTLSGNPLAVTAGRETLRILQENPAFYDQLDQNGQQLKTDLLAIFSEKGMPVSINQVGSMISVHFTEHSVNHYDDSAVCNHDMFKEYFHHMLASGIYLPPSSYESWFFNIQLGDQEIDHILHSTKMFKS